MTKHIIKSISSGFYFNSLDLAYYEKFKDNSDIDYIRITSYDNLFDLLYKEAINDKNIGFLLNGIICSDAYNLLVETDAMSLHTKICNVIKIIHSTDNNMPLKGFNSFGPAFGSYFKISTDSTLFNKKVIILGADTLLGKSIAFECVWGNCSQIVLASKAPNENLYYFADECAHNTKAKVKTSAIDTNKIIDYISNSDIIIDCLGVLEYESKLITAINENHLVFILRNINEINSLKEKLKIKNIFDDSLYFKEVARYAYRFLIG